MSSGSGASLQSEGMEELVASVAVRRELSQLRLVEMVLMDDSTSPGLQCLCPEL